jgi:hypothetical protein
LHYATNLRSKKQQPRQAKLGAAQNSVNVDLALPRLEAWIGLVDDVNAALATDDLVVAVALHQTLEGVADLHDIHLIWPDMLTFSYFLGVHRDWPELCQQRRVNSLNR